MFVQGQRPDPKVQNFWDWPLHLMPTNFEFRLKMVGPYIGSVWGLYLISLLALGDAGLYSLCLTAIYFAFLFWFVAGFCVVLLLHPASRVGLANRCVALWLGVSLHSIAFAYTVAMRVLLMFYITPVWSILSARGSWVRLWTGSSWQSMVCWRTSLC